MVNIFRRRRFPRSVTVLGHKILVRVVKHLEVEGQDLQGAYYPEQKIIYLVRGCDKSVFFHEVLHAAIYLSGNSEGLSQSREESIVIALEHAIFPMI